MIRIAIKNEREELRGFLEKQEVIGTRKVFLSQGTLGIIFMVISMMMLTLLVIH